MDNCKLFGVVEGKVNGVSSVLIVAGFTSQKIWWWAVIIPGFSKWYNIIPRVHNIIGGACPTSV